MCDISPTATERTGFEFGHSIALHLYGLLDLSTHPRLYRWDRFDPKSHTILTIVLCMVSGAILSASSLVVQSGCCLTNSKVSCLLVIS